MRPSQQRRVLRSESRRRLRRGAAAVGGHASRDSAAALGLVSSERNLSLGFDLAGKLRDASRFVVDPLALPSVVLHEAIVGHHVDVVVPEISYALITKSVVSHLAAANDNRTGASCLDSPTPRFPAEEIVVVAEPPPVVSNLLNRVVQFMPRLPILSQYFHRGALQLDEHPRRSEGVPHSDEEVGKVLAGEARMIQRPRLSLLAHDTEDQYMRVVSQEGLKWTLVACLSEY